MSVAAVRFSDGAGLRRSVGRRDAATPSAGIIAGREVPCNSAGRNRAAGETIDAADRHGTVWHLAAATARCDRDVYR